MLEIGQLVSDFTLPTSGGGSVNFSELKGSKVVLFFYPKDDTPGCTIEAKGFSSLSEEFGNLNVKIYGVSKDSEIKHDKFVSKYGLKLTLISDENGDLCEKFGVWVQKSMFGKKYMGIDRTTFLIDENGHVSYIWKKVSPIGHSEEVLNYIKSR